MINLNNFSKEECARLREIHERVIRYKAEDKRNDLEKEVIILRRLLLEAITALLHNRRPNNEFIEIVSKKLRLDKLP